jgi:flagellar protein FlaI
MLRRITEVAEISGMEGNKPRLNPIWKYEPSTDKIVETGVPSKFRETLCSSAGIRASDFEAAIQMREQILIDLQAEGRRSIEDVTKIFQSYYSASR